MNQMSETNRIERRREQLLYLDCASGISGDMFAAAMIDLGADRKKLQRALDSIPTGGFRTEISRVKKQAIDCCDFRVILDAELANHDDDMEYLFGAEPHTHGHGHRHTDTDAAHAHDEPMRSHTRKDELHVHDGSAHAHTDADESHAHDGSAHVHADADGSHMHGADNSGHRTLQDVREILAVCDMTARARTLADRIFVILAEAEAKAHGTTVDQVHFHEVGAIDSIVDIVTAAVCFDSLGVERVCVSPMYEGSGTVRCAHGLLPIPVPAVSNILAASSLKLSVDTTTQGEFITPTGAAIAAALVTESALPDSFAVLRIGLGAGKRDYARTNYLRAMLLEPERDYQDAGICKLETDIDDCSGEVLGYVLERLMDAGARDAHFIPVYMKKNRPAWQLQVICRESEISAMEDIIFSETTSIGIRRVRMERTVLAREIIQTETPYGSIAVKVCRHRGQTRCYPEYESVAAAARRQHVPFADVFDAAQAQALAQMEMHGK